MSAELPRPPETPDPAAATVDPIIAAAIRNEVKVRKDLTATHREVEFVVAKRHVHDVDLATYVMALCQRYPREYLERWCTDGRMTVDGIPARADQAVTTGQRVLLLVPLPPPDPTYQVPPLELLWHDEHLACANKATGHLAHQAGRIMTGTLLNQLQDYHMARGGLAADVRLVNRIDRDTSGIILASFSHPAHVALSQAMAYHRFSKEYLAICHGVPAEAHGHWRDPIGLPRPQSTLRCIRPDGQPSHTEYHVEASDPGGRFALLRILLHTGRQHQIRIHASHHGHPLIGDWCYGLPCAELPGQALHAAVLEFPHPTTGERIRVEAPLRDSLAALWRHLCAGGTPTPRELTDDQRSKLAKG
jgi:23S rRNA pseudouridine1911/1915/1917 synthase